MREGFNNKTIMYKKGSLQKREKSNCFDVYNFNQIDIDWAENKVHNGEDSTFQSDYYHRHFSENLNPDSLNIYTEDSTGENIIAHQDFQFGTETCGRCVYTFKLHS